MKRAACPVCRGDGATYIQVRVGQHATPFVCTRCDGDGDVPVAEVGLTEKNTEKEKDR